MKKLLLFSTLILTFFASAQKITIIPSVGYAWRTAEIADGLPSENEEYYKNLKSGLNFDISAYYNINSSWGLGLKFSNFNASTTGDIVVFQNSEEVLYNRITTKDHISFVGPSAMYSNFNNTTTKHKFFYDLALGLISYSSKSGSGKITGSNLGMDTNIAYQYAFTNNIFVGPKLGYTFGTLTKLKVNGRSIDLDGQKEDLGRVTLNLAVTLRF